MKINWTSLFGLILASMAVGLFLNDISFWVKAGFAFFLGFVWPWPVIEKD